MTAITSNTYKSSFFITPSYILDLPGLTLGFLKVYETIFQFWNHNQLCFLSEESICERTGLGRSQVYEALAFFESHNELIRRRKNGKRYLVRPERLLHTDCAISVPTSAPADCNVRSSGQTTSAPADHNNKNRNKEINCVGKPPPHTQFSKKESAEKKAFECSEIKSLFESKFSKREITYEQMFTDCKEHYEQKSLWVTKTKFLKWVDTERVDNYKKKGEQKAFKTVEERNKYYISLNKEAAEARNR